MALKQTTLQQIATLLKIKPTDLETAIKAETEVDLVVDDKLQTFTAEDLTTRDANKYKEGKTAGEEMLVKEIKRKHNIEVDGNDPDKVVDAITKKAVKDANIAPDAKVAEKDKTIEQLREALKTKDTELSGLQTATAQAKKDAALLAMLPANRDDRFSNEQYLTLIKTEFDIVEQDGKQVVKNIKTGEIVKNTKDFTPLAPSEVIKTHFESAKWIKEQQQQQPGGRGGASSKPGEGAGMFNKLSEVRKHAEDNGINIQGEKFQAMVTQAKKENPQLVID